MMNSCLSVFSRMRSTSRTQHDLRRRAQGAGRRTQDGRCRTFARTLLLIGIFSLVPLASAERLERELWYTGTIADQPAASMSITLYTRDDGSRRSVATTRILLARALGGQAARIEISETQEFVENADGAVTEFRIDQDQNGAVTSAVGTVTDTEIIAVISRLGRSNEQRVAIPADAPLLGMQSAQELLISGTLGKPGDAVTSSTPVLMSGKVAIMRSTAELVELRADGSRLFLMKTPVIPPFRTLIDAQGDLIKMEINLGFLSLILDRADGPVPLAGAEIQPTGLAKAAGPAPARAASNRFNLGTAAASIPDDAFQTRNGDIVTATSTGNGEVPDEATQAALLRAAPQYELDDPELRAWVFAAGEHPPARLAELLRLRVRTHLSNKDLSMADGSALEAFRSRTGDCTEHANLLTAALRIAGIPARTEVGVVYAGDFGGWVGHAWNSAWVDGTWVHLDSAYPGIPRSLYLKFASTSDDDALGTAGALSQAILALSDTAIEYLPAGK